ncbi:hypothetical protein BKA70DRAFT_667128 [Coprinopsis sp. MPI-PUGE-AT-0042]|nr:hypothetical protein BKA70DRAFT_667128 [Coprinopsis sp. MPI-PUGE-AT-0042]
MLFALLFALTVPTFSALSLESAPLSDALLRRTTTQCAAGTYSSNGKSPCTNCPAGYMCPTPGLNAPQKCSPGRYSTGGAKECIKCAAGTFNNIEKATSCCPCAAGWFLAVPGNVNCQQCPSGTPYSLPGASAMSQCSAKPLLHTPSKTSNQGPGSTCPSSTPLPTHKPPHRRLLSPRSFCKTGQMACPVYNGAAQEVIDYDCVDVQNNLESCGGCPTYGAATLDGGKDCSAIPFVGDVRCYRAKCQVGSCQTGYVVSAAKDACVPAI